MPEEVDGESPRDRMEDMGLKWVVPSKKPGSRVSGADLIESMLRASRQSPMEGPGLFFSLDSGGISLGFFGVKQVGSKETEGKSRGAGGGHKEFLHDCSLLYRWNGRLIHPKKGAVY